MHVLNCQWVPFGRTRCRRDDNIKMDFEEIWREDVLIAVYRVCRMQLRIP
jgi:hypothetical protein